MSSTIERLACPIGGCAADFARRDGLVVHLTKVHGVAKDSAEYRRLMGLRPKNAARNERKQGYSTTVDAQIAETVKPLKETLRGIVKQLADLDQERQRLVSDRKRIEQVLKVIDPTSFVAAPRSNGGVSSPNHIGSEERNEERRQVVVAFLEAHRADYEDGLLASVVARDMKAAGIEPVMSPTKVLRTIEVLHAQGVLRADKKVRGGAMQYKFIGNGASDGEA